MFTLPISARLRINLLKMVTLSKLANHCSNFPHRVLAKKETYKPNCSQANIKKTLALQELERLKRIHQNEQKNVHNNIHRLNNQLENIKQQITGQNRQIRLAEKTLNKNKF